MEWGLELDQVTLALALALTLTLTLAMASLLETDERRREGAKREGRGVCVCVVREKESVCGHHARETKKSLRLPQLGLSKGVGRPAYCFSWDKDGMRQRLFVKYFSACCIWPQTEMELSPWLTIR